MQIHIGMECNCTLGRQENALRVPWTRFVSKGTAFTLTSGLSAHHDYTPALRPIRHGVEAGRAGQVSGAVARRQGTPAHGANSVIILGGTLGGRFRLCAAKFFGMMVARDGIEPPTPAFSGL